MTPPDPLVSRIRSIYLERTFSVIAQQASYYPVHRRLIREGACLNDLPLIGKDTVRQQLDSFLFPSDNFITALTGSTTGTPLLLYKSIAEISETQMFFDEHFPSPLHRNTLVIDNGHHGKYATPLTQSVFYLPLKNRFSAQLIFDVLGSGLPTPNGRVPMHVLTLSSLNAKVLFSLAQETEFRFPTGLQIVISSSHLTARWENIIQAQVKSRILREYGLAEFNQGNAWQCPVCSLYHFPPTVLPELTGSDCGTLIMSSLFPFAQTMILLRYNTEDLFYKGPYCCAYDDFGYAFLGRCASTSDEANSKLTSAMVAEVLETKEWAVYAVFKEMSSITQRTDISYARFRINPRRDKTTIFIETLHKNVDKVAVMREIQQTASSFLRNSCPIKLDVQFVEPFALGEDYSKY